jgi:hypothetical protein
MEGIKIKSDNVEYKYKNNILKLQKKQTSTLNNGTIEFIGKKNIFLRFSFNKKLVTKIVIHYENTVKSITNIPHHGIMISCLLNLNSGIKLEIEFVDFCSQVNIFNIGIRDASCMSDIILDNIYIINLPRRTDRAESIKRLMSNVGIHEYKFIYGLDGQDPDIIKQFVKLKKNNIPTSGHYGCLLSHIKAIELAKRKKLNSVLILEDDVLLEDNFIERISRLRVPDWDIIYFGGLIPEKKLFLNDWALCNSVMGAYGYLIKSHMYEIILKELCTYIDCVDICIMKNIQPYYKIILLNDFVKTNINDTDTSNKTRAMKMMIDKIKD